ncbi:hypothetical protein CRUP_025313, partial [Coryphaenoides rupestris]
MLSVDDHISKKYAFKATHPNMRTYYFCTDTAKDMEVWMKAMTDAALVHSEPIRRLDKLKLDPRSPPDLHRLVNHRSLTRPEIQNNERNREAVVRHHSMSRVDERRHHIHHHIHHQGGGAGKEQQEKPGGGGGGGGGGNNNVRIGGSGGGREREFYTLQRDGERYVLHKGGERYALRKDAAGFSLQKAGPAPMTPGAEGEGEEVRHAIHHSELESYAAQKVDDKYTMAPPPQTAPPPEEKYAPLRDGEKYLLAKDGEKYALQRVGGCHTLQGGTPTTRGPQREVRRQLSLREPGDRYGTMLGGVHGGGGGGVHVVDRYGALKEVKKYATLREGDRYVPAAAGHRQADKYATLRDVGGERYGFPRDPAAPDRPLTKINSLKLQPAQAAAITAAISASRQSQAAHGPAPQVNGPEPTTPGEPGDLRSPAELEGRMEAEERGLTPEEAGVRGLSRTSSMQQLEHWVRTHNSNSRGPEEEGRRRYPGTCPATAAPRRPRYPEGYRTLPRNAGGGMQRPGSVASAAGSLYDEKRGGHHYGTLPTTKTMVNISEHGPAHSIPPSPSHGSLTLYATYARHHHSAHKAPPPAASPDPAPWSSGVTAAVRWTADSERTWL